MDETHRLLARDVCQVLREVIFGRSHMTKLHEQTASAGCGGHFIVDDGAWRLSICCDGDQLDHCEQCVAFDGRRWSLDSGDRFGTDPVALLSTWEHKALEQLLNNLSQHPAGIMAQ